MITRRLRDVPVVQAEGTHDSQEATSLQSSPQFSLELVQLLQQPFSPFCSLVLSLRFSCVEFVSVVFDVHVVVVVLYMFQCGVVRNLTMIITRPVVYFVSLTGGRYMKVALFC